MDNACVAWAAGFFEAEGCLTDHLPKGRKTRRPTLDVSQRGEGTAPEVLLRFQEIVEAGQIFGPYRGYLYYWRTHDTGIIAATLTVLWPWLTPEKKAQAARTLASVPALWCTELLGEILESHIASARTNVERHAWAAGFFEGDGSIGMYPSRPEQSSRRRLNVSIG